jgi:molybdopterin-guanine dinucleotide biosynthesis protein A
MAKCTGVILAGGGASRFGGRPKGLERVGGRRIIDRVAEALQPVTDELLLIANDPSATGWRTDLRVAGDVLQNVGSVAGIHAALVHAGGPAIIVAWDMPFVPSSLLRELRDRGVSADAVVPESDSRRGLEPLCAWYSPACVPAIERAIARGDRRIVAFFDEVRLVRLPASDVARHGDAERIFMNVNTAEELSAAESRAAEAAAGRDHRA